MAPAPSPPTLGQVLARPALRPDAPWWEPYESPAALATHLATASAQGKSVYVPAGGRSAATIRSRIKRALKDATIRDVQIRLRPHGSRGFAAWLTPYFAGSASPTNNGARDAARAALRASTPARFLTKKLPARPRSIRARAPSASPAVPRPRARKARARKPPKPRDV